MKRAVRLAVVLAVASIAAPVAGLAQTSPVAQSPAVQPATQSPEPNQPPNPQSPSPQPQSPRTQVYYHAGSWDAFSGRGDRDALVCGVGTTNPVDRRSLSLRFTIGGVDTTFTARKPGWSIPDGTQVSVVMQIGLATPWTLRGTGHGNAVDWTLDRDSIQAFDAQFRNAQSMTVTFPDGNEPPWVLSLAGSTAISNTFGVCITDLTRQAEAGAPSAAGSAAPQSATQPFSAATSAPPAH